AALGTDEVEDRAPLAARLRQSVQRVAAPLAKNGQLLPEPRPPPGLPRLGRTIPPSLARGPLWVDPRPCRRAPHRTRHPPPRPGPKPHPPPPPRHRHRSLDISHPPRRPPVRVHHPHPARVQVHHPEPRAGRVQREVVRAHLRPHAALRKHRPRHPAHPELRRI